jgi:hypothetical protein
MIALIDQTLHTWGADISRGEHDYVGRIICILEHL